MINKTMVKEMNEFSGNKIGEPGARVLSEALIRNSSLTELHLWVMMIELIHHKTVKQKIKMVLCNQKR